MNENKKRKIRTGIMAALLMLLILLTGTYAWTQFNNIGFNAVYTNTNFGGRMHNNLEVKENSGEGVYNQNIFAENFGDNRIFVRARLREFMSTTEDGIPLIEGTHIKFPNGGTDGETTFEEWPLYQAQDGDVHTRRANTPSAIIGQNGIRWTLGHTGGDMYFMPTFNRTQGGDPSFLNGLHTSGVDVPFITETNAEWAHQMIEASGDAVDAWAARVLEEGAVDFDISNIEEARDIRTLGAQTSPQRADLEHSNGLRNFWEGATSAPTHYIYVDEDGFLTQSEEPIVEEARTTLLPEVPAGTKNGVMTFSEWNEIGREQGNFWVMDAQTGWFYFAMPLQPGEATPMLISEIEVQDRNDEGIEYVIEVDAQFMTRSSMTTSIMEDLNENVALLWGETEYEMKMEGMIEPTETVSTADFANNIEWTIQPETPGITVHPAGNNLSATVTVASDVESGPGIVSVVATVPTANGPVSIERPINVIRAVRDTFIDEASTNETEWVILVDYDDEFGGIGNALYITRYIHGWSGSGDSRRWNLLEEQGGPGNVFTMFESSNVRQTMLVWYENDDYVSPEFRARGLNYQFVDDGGQIITDRNTPGAGIENNSSNTEHIILSATERNSSTVPRALSRPAPSGPGEPFVLSASEANVHFTGQTGVHGRQAQRLDNGVNDDWWLRTPGASVTNVMANISSFGNMSSHFISTEIRLGFRPAIWVRR